MFNRLLIVKMKEKRTNDIAKSTTVALHTLNQIAEGTGTRSVVELESTLESMRQTFEQLQEDVTNKELELHQVISFDILFKQKVYYVD